MALIFNHESGIVGAYATIRQTNNRKGNMDVILDVYLSKAAYKAGKPPVANAIEAHGPHDLLGTGNAWQKGYAVAKTHPKLEMATDDI
jgi:hypothetical protein